MTGTRFQQGVQHRCPHPFSASEALAASCSHRFIAWVPPPDPGTAHVVPHPPQPPSPAHIHADLQNMKGASGTHDDPMSPLFIPDPILPAITHLEDWHPVPAAWPSAFCHEWQGWQTSHPNTGTIPHPHPSRPTTGVSNTQGAIRPHLFAPLLHGSNLLF